MHKINYSKTLELGFGFFAISLTWSIYNAFMPKILSNFIASTTLIGIIMTIDNYAAFIIQPTVGTMSDNINTRFGKRMPFVIIGMPLATIFLICIANYQNFISLFIFLILMNISMSIFRSPVISLMPDITHKENRSMANSIINFMGGFGAVLAYLVGSNLWDKNKSYPFYLAAFFMFVSFLVIIRFIDEKRDGVSYKDETPKKMKIIDALKSVSKRKNVMLLFLAILFWFIGYHGIEMFFTLYGEKVLNIKTSTAAFSFTFISIAFLISAIPAGIIGTKLGKLKTILIGIVGMIICLFILFLLRDINLIRILFIFTGIFWALININSYPFVTDMAPKGQTGTFTGLYYFFSSIALISAPTLQGIVIDLVGYRYMFLFAVVSFIIALGFAVNIKREVETA